MSQGLTPSTHRTYEYAQHRFVDFCPQLGRLHRKGSPCPTVMLYCPEPCCSILAYFGFLRASEFTVPSSSDFNPLLHLTIAATAVDSQAAPTCLRFTIKTSRSDPFRKCCQIFIGQGNPPLCALSASEFTVPSSSYSKPINPCALPGTAWKFSWSTFLSSDDLPLSHAFLSQWSKDTL